MKQGKKLTREMKVLLSRHKLNANDFSLLKSDNSSYTFINKKTDEIKTLNKENIYISKRELDSIEKVIYKEEDE